VDTPTGPNLLTAFSSARVLIVGDIILDEYLWGDVRRISPEAPVPVVEIRARTLAPGGAANVASNVVSLTGNALLGGVVGCDPQAQQLEELLRSQGVDPSGVIADGQRVTTTKTRLLAHSQQVVRMDSEQRMPLSPLIEESLLRWVDRHVPEVQACILSDYGKGVVSPRVAEHVIYRSRQAGKPMIVDPKGTQYAKYRGATLVKPNIHEVEQIWKEDSQDTTGLVDAARYLIDLLQGAAVLITRGAEGMSLFRAGCAPKHITAVARQVFDVTGAGDTVVSTLALALAARGTLDQAVDLANLAAGVAVGKRGTARVLLDEVRESALSHAVLDRDQAR
jgi:D-beta-D-heptose 7-phosphate kinase/D-beta-D-heptose 1-phosphate adenosyltransferase